MDNKVKALNNFIYHKKGKYNAQKVIIDGEKFDSKKEAVRWGELLILQRAGEISDLKRQVKYVLIPAQYEPDTVGKRGSVKRGKLIEREVAYIADFVYTGKDGETVVEDCKGFKTKEYLLKRKMILHFYGIRIKET